MLIYSRRGDRLCGGSVVFCLIGVIHHSLELSWAWKPHTFRERGISSNSSICISVGQEAAPPGKIQLSSKKNKDFINISAFTMILYMALKLERASVGTEAITAHPDVDFNELIIVCKNQYGSSWLFIKWEEKTKRSGDSKVNIDMRDMKRLH